MDHGGPNVKTSVTGAMSGAESDTGSGMASPGTNTMDELGNDAEGIWSPDIEQSFQEALAIYPPCGRRKIILSDEGKMYGRNELIARYIKLRTGKTRSRKQVSSHIQVLSRRKAKEVTTHLKDHSSKESVLQTVPSAHIATPSASTTVPNKPAGASLPSPPVSLQIPATHPALEPPVGFAAGQMYPSGFPPQLWSGVTPTSDPAYYLSAYSLEKPLVIVPNAAEVAPPWRDRSIVGPKLRLVELSAFVDRQQEGEAYNGQHLFVHIGNNITYSDPVLESVDIRQIADKFPDKTGGLRELFDKGPQSAFFLVKFWADINTEVTDEIGSFYGVSNLYESTVDMVIQCSTKVCSFGKQVVEKIETEYSQREGSHFTYRIERSPMCEYLVNFIHKLKHLPKKYMMNSVLENFTILQVVTNKDTQETLLCIAYVFEVSTSEHGTQHNIYRLIKD